MLLEIVQVDTWTLIFWILGLLAGFALIGWVLPAWRARRRRKEWRLAMRNAGWKMDEEGKWSITGGDPVPVLDWVEDDKPVADYLDDMSEQAERLWESDDCQTRQRRKVVKSER